MADSAAALGAGARVGADPRRRTPRGLLLRVATWARRPWLDGKIANGVAPRGGRAVALREAQLVGAPERRRLARRFEEILAAPRRRPGFSSAVPVDGDAVRVARPILTALVLSLRSSDVVEARGVVLARRLLTDAGSPIYAVPGGRSGNPDRLWYEVLAVLFALRPLSAEAPTRP